MYPFALLHIIHSGILYDEYEEKKKETEKNQKSFFQLYQEGIINGLYNKWFRSNSFCSMDELSGTRLETITSLLVMLTAGILVSLIILFVEKLLTYTAKSAILKNQIDCN